MSSRLQKLRVGSSRVSPASTASPIGTGFTVYSEVPYTQLKGGGLTFKDVQPTFQGKSEKGKDFQGKDITEYNWTENSVRPDGSIHKSEIFRRSNDSQSERWRQETADGQSRVIQIWGTYDRHTAGDSLGDFLRIALQVVVEDWCNPDGFATVHPKNTSLIGSLLTRLSNNLKLGPGPSHPIGVNGKLPSGAGKPGQSDQWEMLRQPDSTSNRPPRTWNTEREDRASGVHFLDPGAFQSWRERPVDVMHDPVEWGFQDSQASMIRPEHGRRDSVVE